jgi:8-oxo-dGTP pyrophosphatase MutT (NUDIX family)
MELDVVAWIHTSNNRLLTVRARGRDLLYLPGGKRDPGETHPEAISREVREELGLDLPPRAFRELGTVLAPAHDQPLYERVRMVCFTAGHTGPVHPSAEIDECLYVGEDQRHLLAPASLAAFELAQRHALLQRERQGTRTSLPEV